MRTIKIILNVVISILLFTSLLLLFNYSFNKKTKEELFTIEEARGYVIDEDRYMSFNIYSNMKSSLIDNTSMTSFTLSLNDFNIALADTSVEVIKMDDYYIHRLSASVPNITDNELTGRAYLSCVNSNFQCRLDLGYLGILNKEAYELLSISHLSVSDSYIDKHLIITGLNIGLTNKYSELRSLRIGGIGFGRLDLAIEGELPGIINIKEVVPSYSVREVNNTTLRLQGQDYFIPITYYSPVLLRESYITMELDNKKYYLDTFTYKTQAPDLEEYKDKILKGEITCLR